MEGLPPESHLHPLLCGWTSTEHGDRTLSSGLPHSVEQVRRNKEAATMTEDVKSWALGGPAAIEADKLLNPLEPQRQMEILVPSCQACYRIK
jgi:hypothetical protein